jgi:hypothetical protein
LTSKVQFFKQSLMQHPRIKYVVSANSIPGKPVHLIQNGLSEAEDHDSTTGSATTASASITTIVDALGLTLWRAQLFRADEH